MPIFYPGHHAIRPASPPPTIPPLDLETTLETKTVLENQVAAVTKRLATMGETLTVTCACLDLACGRERDAAMQDMCVTSRLKKREVAVLKHFNDESIPDAQFGVACQKMYRLNQIKRKYKRTVTRKAVKGLVTHLKKRLRTAESEWLLARAVA
jgi:hypothetical protein